MIHTHIEAMEKALSALKQVACIIGDSQGVAGYHLNGDVAIWDEFDEVNTVAAAIAELNAALSRSCGPGLSEKQRLQLAQAWVMLEDYADACARSAGNDSVAEGALSSAHTIKLILSGAREVVRFCPECGYLGEVAAGCIDCCPDGGAAAYMPLKTAEACRKLFYDSLPRARDAAVPMVPSESRRVVID